MSYQLTSTDAILRLEDQVYIPADPANVDYQAYLAWSARGNTAQAAPVTAPAPDYWVFWATLLATDAYQAIRQQAAASLPMNTAATEFIALIGDAKAGRPLVPAIQASISAVLALGTFSAANLAEFRGALVAGHLDGVYTLPNA